MATKPATSTLPRWADTVSANPARVVNPPSGKKDIGWDVAEKPPAQWKNWLLLQTYNWLVWLDAFETEAHTWTKTQTFGQGISCSNTLLNTRAIYGVGNGTAEGVLGVGGPGGHGVIGEGSAAGTYGVFGRGSAAGVIGVRGEGNSAFGGSFLGGGSSQGVVGTGGTAGAPGVSGQGTTSFAGITGQGGPTGRGGEFTGGAGGNPCGARCVGGGTDGHGVEAVGTGTGYAVQATGSIHTDLHVMADQSVVAGTLAPDMGTLRGSYTEYTAPVHPSVGASIKGRVAPANTARVLATITTDGAGNLTVQDAQGVSGAAIVGGNKIQINFVDAFAVAGKYQVSVTGYDTGTGGGGFAVIDADKNTGNVKVLCPSNPTTNALNFDIVCTGRQ